MMSLGDLKETCQMGRLACQSDSNLTFPGFRCVEEIKILFQILGKIQGKGLSPPTYHEVEQGPGMGRCVFAGGGGGGGAEEGGVNLDFQFPWAVSVT